MIVLIIRTLLIVSLLLLSACSSFTEEGDCIELTDGTGRLGHYVGFRNAHIIRMLDTGNLRKVSWSQDFMKVNQSRCDDKIEEMANALFN